MSNNSDLISRQAVIRAIRNHINVNRERADRGYAAMIREEDIEIIEQLPSAERIGEWIRLNGYVCGNYQWQCSACKKQYWESLRYPDRTDFCPNCGARMINGGNFDETH